MNELPPKLARPSSRNGWLIYSVLSTFLLILSVTVNCILLVALVGAISSDVEKYEEHYVSGDATSANKIAVIYLNGVISYQADGHATPEGMVGAIKEQLQQALDDDAVKAIVLRINSPGGEVVASDAIYRALVDAREQKHIVANIETMGASGAYYAALGCDRIVANELSITGSIGVIMSTLTFEELLKNWGIRAHTFKSGDFKDILNPAREPTEAEKDYMNQLIMEIYGKFVDIVVAERGMKKDQLEEKHLIDGRIFSGESAQKEGLVDEVGGYDEAVNAAMSLAGVSDAQVVRYQAPFTLSDLFGFAAPAKPAQVKISLEMQPTKMEMGKLYFLPSYMFE